MKTSNKKVNKMEEFVSFEQAKALKELGFDWECSAYYYVDTKEFRGDISPDNHNYRSEIVASAPTLAQAQRWLREVKYIFLIVDVAYKETYDDDATYYWRTCDHMGWRLENSKDDDAYFDTYEQSLSAGIDRVLETLKEKRK